jgi:hypothetical protein
MTSVVSGSRRPAQLDDRAWLTAQLERYGTTEIARRLGTTRKVVRLACQRLNIPPHPEGRRRGTHIRPLAESETQPPVLTEAAEMFAAPTRIATPTYTTLLTHLAAADRARKAHDRVSERDAAIAGAATWLRIADQIDQAA